MVLLNFSISIANFFIGIANFFIGVMRVIFYLILAFPRIVRMAKLVEKRDFTTVIALCNEYLCRKPHDVIALQCIAKSYIWMGESTKGFEYLKKCIPGMMSSRLVNQMAHFFIFPELNHGKYSEASYRSNYFLENNKHLSPQLKNQFTQIISYCAKQQNKEK